MSASRRGLIVLGNQLFATKWIEQTNATHLFLAEHSQLASYYKFHKHKIILFFSAMRHFAEEMRLSKKNVFYHFLAEIKSEKKYTEYLNDWIEKEKITEVLCYEIEDKFFEKEISDFLMERKLPHTFLPSPMFLTTRQEFKNYLANGKKPFMKTFYEQQRKRLGVLLEKNGKPVNGKWSFDTENRNKLPKNIQIPKGEKIKIDAITNEVMSLVDSRFSDHPGNVDNFWLPVTREETIVWFKKFVSEKLENFGTYQDAITLQDPFVFHSVITPMMNIGLITPKEVIQYVLQFHRTHPLHYPSLEGFVRQVIGWREFIRGIYQNYSELQSSTNFWNHKRQLKKCWYDGTTLIPVLDDAIHKVVKYGYGHHIERLMIFSNFMTLCQIDPKEAHKWFMEMFVDSSDWVMGPNVYGMGLWSDGGLFATKPYICGSNYYLKMSDYKKGDWCDTVDALYWNFIDTHRAILEKNYRFGIMMAQLKKIDSQKMQKHRLLAKEFIASVSEDV